MFIDGTYIRLGHCPWGSCRLGDRLEPDGSMGSKVFKCGEFAHDVTKMNNWQ